MLCKTHARTHAQTHPHKFFQQTYTSKQSITLIKYNTITCAFQKCNFSETHDMGLWWLVPDFVLKIYCISIYTFPYKQQCF